MALRQRHLGNMSCVMSMDPACCLGTILVAVGLHTRCVGMCRMASLVSFWETRLRAVCDRVE